jgi:hypothetical protein
LGHPTKSYFFQPQINLFGKICIGLKLKNSLDTIMGNGSSQREREREEDESSPEVLGGIIGHKGFFLLSFFFLLSLVSSHLIRIGIGGYAGMGELAEHHATLRENGTFILWDYDKKNNKKVIFRQKCEDLCFHTQIASMFSKKYKIVLQMMQKGGPSMHIVHAGNVNKLYGYIGFETEEEHQKWRAEMTKLGVADITADLLGQIGSVYGQGAADTAAAKTYGAGGSPSAQTSGSKVKSFCGGCGAKNEDNEAFCTKCGGSLAT